MKLLFSMTLISLLVPAPAVTQTKGPKKIFQTIFQRIKLDPSIDLGVNKAEGAVTLIQEVNALNKETQFFQLQLFQREPCPTKDKCKPKHQLLLLRNIPIIARKIDKCRLVTYEAYAKTEGKDRYQITTKLIMYDYTNTICDNAGVDPNTPIVIKMAESILSPRSSLPTDYLYQFLSSPFKEIKRPKTRI